MEESQKNMSHYLAIIARRRYWAVSTLLIIFLASVGIAFGLSPVYQSTSTILIEQQEIPQDLIRSTVTSYADQRINMISQRVMSRTNLLKIIKRYNLYPDEIGNEPNEKIVEEMHDDINVDLISDNVVDPRSGRPVEATIAFTLSFEYTAPLLAQKVVNELTSLYLSENLKNRTQKAIETSDFLNHEANKLETRIGDIEKKLAVFKKNNAGRLPAFFELNTQMLDRYEREVSEIDRQMRGLRERKISLESQLAKIEITDDVYDKNGRKVMSPRERLTVLRMKYASLSSVYDKSHPDMIRMRKEIAALEGLTNTSDENGASSASVMLDNLETELLLKLKKYSPDHPEIKRLQREIKNLKREENDEKAVDVALKGKSKLSVNTPIKIELTSRLKAVNIELNSLTKKRVQQQIRVAGYEQKLNASPEVEREYRILSRDYQNVLSQYKQIKAKQMEAQLAKALESERKGERFTLIDPAILPEEPIKPNRLAILFAGFVLSVMAGVTAAVVRDNIDDTVYGSQSLVSVFGGIPLVSIPYIENIDEIRHKKGQRAAIGICVFVLFVALAWGINYFLIPLDVAWYTALRRLGI